MLTGFKKLIFDTSGLRYRIAHFMNDTGFYQDYSYELHEDIIIENGDSKRKYRKPELKKHEIIVKDNVEHVFYDYDNINPKIICSSNEYNLLKLKWMEEKPNIQAFFQKMKDDDKEYIVNDNGQLELKNQNDNYTGELIDNETNHIVSINPEWYYQNDNRQPYMNISQLPDKPLLEGIFGKLDSTTILIICGTLCFIILVVAIIIFFKVPIMSLLGKS